MKSSKMYGLLFLLNTVHVYLNEIRKNKGGDEILIIIEVFANSNTVIL